jgi:hypothetical protein
MALATTTSNFITQPSKYSQFITVKLTHNFLLWQTHILLYLRSQHLIGYIINTVGPGEGCCTSA